VISMIIMYYIDLLIETYSRTEIMLFKILEY